MRLIETYNPTFVGDDDLYTATENCSIPMVTIEVEGKPKCGSGSKNYLVIKHNSIITITNSFYTTVDAPTGYYEWWFWKKGCEKTELLYGSFTVIRANNTANKLSRP